MPDLSELDRILDSLQSDDEKVREAAKGDLVRLRHEGAQLTAAQGLKALRAAARPYPFDKPAREDVSEPP